MRPFRLALAVLPGVLVATSASADEPPHARLAYVHDAAIERCPSERELKDSVGSRLGYDPFAAASPDEPRQILVQVRRKGTGIVGSLEILGPKPGQKELSSPRGDCRELVDALAVAIALAIDPASLSRPAPPPPPPPAPPPPPPPEPTPLPPPIVTKVDRPPEPSDEDRVSVVAGAGPRVFFNELPSVVPAAAVHIGVRYRWFEPRIEGLGTLSGSDTRSGRAGEVSASLLAASILPCAHVSFAYGCAGVTLGSLRGEGTGVATPQRGSDLYASVDARGGVEIEVSRSFSIQIHLDVVAPLTRVALQLDGQDVFTVPAIGARLGAAAAIRF